MPSVSGQTILIKRVISGIWFLLIYHLGDGLIFKMRKKKYDETLELQLYALSPDLDLLDRPMTQFLPPLSRAYYRIWY